MNEDSTQVQEAPVAVQNTSEFELEKSAGKARDQFEVPLHSTYVSPSKFRNTSEILASSLNVDGIKRFALLLFGDIVAVLFCAAFSWSLSVALRQLLNADALDAQLLTRQLCSEE